MNIIPDIVLRPFQTFDLSVDHEKELEDMVVAGRYDSWDKTTITSKNFRITGKETEVFEAYMHHPNGAWHSDEVITLARCGDPSWEPARIEHLLSFGAEYPEEQRLRMIVGLGSVCKVSRIPHVPYLFGNDSRRCLGLDKSAKGRWHYDIWFLFIRRKTSQTLCS